MIEITFLCIIHNLWEENYNDKLFGKLLIQNFNDEVLDEFVKFILDDCLEQFNNKGYNLRLYKLGILGINRDFKNSKNDKEIFDIFINKIENKFSVFDNEIVLN